jgi:hypothetical protein
MLRASTMCKKPHQKVYVAMLVVTLYIVEEIIVFHNLIDDLKLMGHPQAIKNFLSLFSLMDECMIVEHVGPSLYLKFTSYIVEEFKK